MRLHLSCCSGDNLDSQPISFSAFLIQEEHQSPKNSQKTRGTICKMLLSSHAEILPSVPTDKQKRMANLNRTPCSNLDRKYSYADHTRTRMALSKTAATVARSLCRLLKIVTSGVPGTSLTRVTKSYLLALGTTHTSSYITKH